MNWKILAILALIALVACTQPEDALISELVYTDEFCSSQPSNSERNDCYRELAIQDLDAEICKKMSGLEEPNICVRDVAVLTRDHEACNNIERVRKGNSIIGQATFDKCYESIAYLTGNAALCEEILGIGTLSGCRRNVNFVINDPTVCPNNQGYDMSICYDNILNLVGTEELS